MGTIPTCSRFFLGSVPKKSLNTHLILYASGLSVQEIHVGGEWDVFKVVQKVSDSDAGEDHVDGVPHVPVGEHQDVGEVEQGAQNANQHGQPAVDWMVNVLKIMSINTVSS